MAKIVITIEDTEVDGVPYAQITTEGMVCLGGTAAEHIAYQALYIMSAAEGIPWNSVATEVKPNGVGN